MEGEEYVDFDEQYDDEYDDADDDDEINQDDIWEIVSAYFEEKGLLRHQLDTFNHFVFSTIQELVDETPTIICRQNAQYIPGEQEPIPMHKHLKMRQVSIAKPVTQDPGCVPTKSFPSYCRFRNLTYESKLYVEMDVQVFKEDAADGRMVLKEEVKDMQKFNFGYLPIMLRSDLCHLRDLRDTDIQLTGECPHDQGGYFICNGTEKVLIAQERQAQNHVYVFKKKQPNKHLFSCEIRSCLEGSYRPASTFWVRMLSAAGIGGHRMEATLPYIRVDVPIIAVFRALGFVADRDIMEHIVYNFDDEDMLEALRPSLEHAALLQTTMSALDWIGRRSGKKEGVSETERIEYAKKIMRAELLPHVGVEEFCETKKVYFIGYMVHKLLQGYLGRREEDDRDFFGNKRADTSGVLMAGLFRLGLRKISKELTRKLQMAIDNNKLFNPGKELEECAAGMAKGMRYAMATGNWGGKAGDPGVRTGVAQVLNRLTYNSALSHLRRLNTPIDKGGKETRPRLLHSTHWGYLCPAETPEGHSIGLVKNFSLLCQVTLGTPAAAVMAYLHQWNTQNLEMISPSDVSSAETTKVFINGNWVGIHTAPEAMIQDLKLKRRSRDLPQEVSVVRDLKERELRIWTDSGRLTRPLFVVENYRDANDVVRNKTVIRKKHLDKVREGLDETQVMKWDDLVKMELVDLIDVEEEDSIMIAFNQERIRHPTDALGNELPQTTYTTYTHCEIHPAMIFGICASIIPFPDHNAAPRNTYQSAMGKQAMGVYVSNFLARYDTTAHIMYYPHKPLAATKSMRYMHSNDLPAGQNSVVAISCYSGYNQEDSIIMNQSAIDRGFFRTVFYRSYRDEAKVSVRTGGDENFAKPDFSMTKGLKRASYDKIDEDGLAVPGLRVAGGDIIMGKTCPLPRTAGDAVEARFQYKDASTKLRVSEGGVIDGVLLTTNKEGNRFVKVKVRSIRIPQVGDKFCSRHGQKGTLGITFREEDMPFTQEGIVPDIIMNPHAIPSRMTIGHIFETLLGKVACCQGVEGDATPFIDGFNVNEMSKRLHELGYQLRGNEVLYCGHTGLAMDHKVFLGPTYYQRLKHMVEDKIHSRARGPLQKMAKQPTEGRAKDGGLRFGEMERDCMISHGASSWMKERLFHVSDHYRVHVCDRCGLFAAADLKTKMASHAHSFHCTFCGSSSKISQILIPYCCKLLFQELMAMAIVPRIRTAIV
eukprot:TRINITY_DN14021_c0_g1_i1.p1 TRINITY_DN14021_c0_g1~~TRINITY_DN14021_c0_g1_i1.p1  ORF type:complete len:1236 (+),score=503.55 TRINITY_DN14021_c0_g1_i1:71-3709(+)